MNEFTGKTILVTGGTGSIGLTIIRKLLQFEPKQIRAFSRDDTKQFHARIRLDNDPRVSWLIGDVRDKPRLEMAMEGVDFVFHAAAMKHVIASENNPFEAVKTNVLGTQNVIECALDTKVEKVIGISTDKAAMPTNVMGCTKLLAEKLMSATFHYKGIKKTKFCFVRFGNVIGTRGSVIPLFCRQISQGGPVTLTDPSMRRFFMSIGDAVNLVLQASQIMIDREVFVLKMPILRISDLAQAVIQWYAPKVGRDPASIPVQVIGRQPGERIHEKLIGRDECRNAFMTPEMFVLRPYSLDPTEEIRSDAYPNAIPIEEQEISTETSELDSQLLSPQQIFELLVRSEREIEESIF